MKDHQKSPSSLENFVLNRQKRRTEQMKSQMQNFQERFNKKQKFTNAELTYIVTRLSPHFEENEKQKLEELRRNFTRKNLYCCFLSGINVFIVAAYFKSFLKFTNFKKILFGLGVYLGSFELGMYHVKDNLKNFHSGLLEKYKNEFLKTEFKT